MRLVAKFSIANLTPASGDAQRYATPPTVMKKTPVYCALIEIQPLNGCELEPSEIA